MEYVEGFKVNDPEGMKKVGIDPKKVSKTLTEAFAKMIFKHGFVHCDAHPGNILIRKAKYSDKDLNYQIVLLDHGLYRRVDK